ncbi:MAG: DEAD/DEAH box helicase family protein [Bacilli bacterium]|nr:DEAD/DEAH box helicase family protein [Bacilli bacterium]
MTLDYTLARDFPLKQEQNEMIDFAIKRPYAVISGQTGLGKTYTAVTLATQLMLHNKNLITVIFAPPKAIMSFEKELTQKLKVSYSIISTEKMSINPKARFLIVSYTRVEDSYAYLTELKKKWLLLGICDEAHQLQNRDSAIYKKFCNIRKLFAILYFLTATSCKNNIEGMYWMLNLLNPDILGSWGNFRSRYLLIEKKKITQTTRNRSKVKRTIEEIVGYKNLEELQNILNNVVIVRQKEYKLNFTYHTCKMNEYETEQYLEASKGNNSENAKDFWSVRLRDITMVVDNISDDVEKREKISNKERLLLKVLLNNLKNNKPTIVYCGYIEVLDRLKFLIDTFKKDLGVSETLVIKGSVPMKDRKLIQDLISVDKPCLITSAGGESVNLQRANSIIFYDLPYDISAIMQVIGRITRVDTVYDQQYIDIVEAFGTTDTYKRLCMEKNMKLVESLFGKMNTLPYTTYNNEQKFMSTLRKALLWAFKRGTLVTQEELEDIFQKFNKME